MRRKLHRVPLLTVAAAGFLVGLGGNALWSSDVARRTVRSAMPDLAELTRLEPVRVLPRTELLVLAAEARAQLRAGRPWAAWELLRPGLDEMDGAPATAVLLAARAAGEWGGWHHVRRLLRDQPWLDRVEGGEGWFLLARAEQEAGNRERAAEAYARYLRQPGVRQRGVAQARLAAVLREEGDRRGAAAGFAAAAPLLPEIEDWVTALQVEQLGKAGDPAVATLATRATGGSAPVRLRRVQAEVDGWVSRGDISRAIRRLEWEARVLRTHGASFESAQLHLQRARLLLKVGQGAEARELLRATAWESSVPSELRLEAARLLGEQSNLGAGEELARAAAYEAADKPGLAARALRAAMRAGAPSEGGLRLRLARLLYAERDFGPAREEFKLAAEQLAEPELVAEAELYAARSLFRSAGAAKSAASAPSKGKRSKGKRAAKKPSGPSPREVALVEIRRVVERYEGTAAAGTALFLLGDEAASLQSATSYYRRAAAVRHSPDAREALFRVGDRSLKLKDTAAAIRAWEEYVERYPKGEQTARVAYEVGRLHERAGRQDAARAMYTAATLADPVSYHALRAGNRLGVDPLARILAEPRPWPGLAADPAEAAAVLRRLDALDLVGLTEEWRAELDAAKRAFEARPLAQLTLAEGLRDRGHTVEAIRMGRRLLEQRNGEWDERLLRVVFPFPYRGLLMEVAREFRVDPMLLAGLVRQESSFRTDARSWVGATGLGQVMPATGRWLAPSVGVRAYEEKLLEVPEVNLRMGAKYLSDLLRRYDGARDLALAGYNAGPSRADRWRRELNHGRDTDAFREAIPFDETRNYVKVVLRNQAVYERLYGKPRPDGLVRVED